MEFVLFSLNEARLVTLAARAALLHGLKVNVFMDSRSSPDQLDALHEGGIDYRLARNATNFPEGLFPDMFRQVDSEWIFILNADEWPSPELVRAALDTARSAPADVNCLGVPRRWLRFNETGQLQYSRFWRMRGDYQWRIIRHREVTLNPVVHTPGFFLERQRALRLSRKALLYHLDWVAHSRESRERKLRFYEELGSDYGARFADYYVPERREWIHFFRTIESEPLLTIARDMHLLQGYPGWADAS